MARIRWRATELLLVGYFGYSATVAQAMGIERAPEAWALFALVAVVLFLVACAACRWPQLAAVRDFLPLALLLTAYREMDWFSGQPRLTGLERLWNCWDKTLLAGGLQRAIEAAGIVVPSYLETCYLLVYAVGPFTVVAFYVMRRRRHIDRALFLVLLGTLMSYALFPFFPSDPPRRIFALPAPTVMTPLRALNLWIVNGAGISSSVFPSAHVSGAFAAVWAMLENVRGRKGLKWGVLIYSVSVAVATVYGRYHYAADAAAGIGISLAAWVLFILLGRLRRRLRGLPVSP